MKIVMVGHTGVGKTTYMASLYGIMQQNIKGFRLKTTNTEDSQRLIKLAEAINQGCYPLPTDQRSEYDFNLRYQGADVLTFTWADYRGGSIREKQDSEQAQHLLEDIKQADGIMMFCDSEALLSGNIRSNQLGRMITLISQGIQNLDNPISLGIILTKVDLVPEFTTKMLQPFQGIIKTIEISDSVLGAFIPIACGTKLINVPNPLLFALNSAVIIHSASLVTLAEQYKSSAMEWTTKSKGFSGFVRWVNDKWNGYTTDQEMAESQMEKAISKYQEYESIINPAQALNDYVKDFTIIQSGFTIEDYVYKINQSYQTEFNLKQQNKGSVYQTYLDPFDAFN